MYNDDPGIAKARAAAGGRNIDLARLLGISPAAISQWARVPYRRALQIEARTEGQVTREELRPDLVWRGVPAREGGMSDIELESLSHPRAGARRDGWAVRSARTRAAIVAACRCFMRAGLFRPSLEACCRQAERSVAIGYKTFGSVETLRLEAADDHATRDAIVERVIGCERAALSDETLQRIVRAFVAGAV
jgi:DNA-binding transcriptional regulator YdaS (Cro superfamily)